MQTELSTKEIIEKNEEYRRKKWLRNIAILIVTAVVLFTSLIISAGLGYSKIPAWNAVRTFFGLGSDKEEMILFQFRMPRIAFSAMVGAALAVSGAVMQAMTRNPLADASLMGITSGGGLMVALYAMMAGSSNAIAMYTLPVFSLLGSGLAAFIVYILANRGEDRSPVRLVLTGIAVQAGITALTTVLIVKLNEGEYDAYQTWLTGSMGSVSWTAVLSLLPWLLILLPAAFIKAPKLDILTLGPETATGLGFDSAREQKKILAISVALAAAAVALAGNVGFVGLVAPHLGRRLVGPKHSILLPVSALLGAVLVTAADTLGRIILQPMGLPAGILTAVIGAPYFIYLLSKED